MGDEGFKAVIATCATLFAETNFAKIKVKIVTNNEDILRLELVRIENCANTLADFIVEFIEKMKKNKNEYLTGVYAVGRYAWILKDIKVLDKPIKVKGHLGIWNLD